MPLAMSNYSVSSPMRQQSPSPMASMATAQQRGQSPVSSMAGRMGTAMQRQPGQPGSTPGTTGSSSNYFNYTPMQYNQATMQSYGDQLSQNAKDAANAQQLVNNYGASQQRLNASNAATSGLSAGGGGFLAGQEAATLNTQGQAANTALQYSNQATNIRANQANYEAGVDATNNQNANNYAYQDWAYNRSRADQLADQKASAQTEANANTVATYGQQESAVSKNWTATSAGAGAWNQAQNEYNQAAQNNDKAGMAAAAAKMQNISSGKGFTKDGHSRNDPKLKNRLDSKFTVKYQNPDGSYTYKDGKSGNSYTIGTDGTFTYNGA